MSLLEGQKAKADRWTDQQTNQQKDIRSYRVALLRLENETNVYYAPNF